MALSVTQLTSGTSTANQSTGYSTASVTAASGTWLIVWLVGSGAAVTWTTTGLGLTWTRRSRATFSSRAIELHVAQVPAGTTGALTFTPNAAATGVAWSVTQVTGADQTDVLDGTPTSASGTVTTLSLATPAQTASGNRPMVGYLIGSQNIVNTVSPPSGWTELAEVAYSTPNTKLWTAWSASSYPSSVSVTEDSSYDMYAIGVQLNAASSSTPPPAVTASVALTGSGTLTATSSATVNPSPGSVLNIGSGKANHFSVQVAPTGASGIEVHTQDEIDAGYDSSPYFTTTSSSGNNAVQFYARIDAPTTSGTTYSRSELREANPDGSDAAFDATVGTHEMHGRTRITHLPANKPEVVIAQLHNGNSDRIAIRTQLVSGSIRLRARINGSSVSPDFMSPYVVGTEFEWKIRVDQGAISIFYNDMVTPIITAAAGTLVKTAGVNTWYFKSGLYNQSDTTTDAGTDYGQAELRDLTVTHSGAATPVAVSVALSGSGTLTATTATDLSRPVALSGSGALTSAATPSLAVSAGLSGSGTLTAAAAPSAVRSVQLAGSGTLTVATAIAVTTSVPLTGAGTLTATATGTQLSQSVALTGAGTLTVASTASLARTAALTGTGTLQAVNSPELTAGVQLAGSGALTATAAASLTADVQLSGTGTLTAVGLATYGAPTIHTYGTSALADATATAALASDGVTLSALAGDGTATAALAPALATATAIAQAIGTAALVGDGTSVAEFAPALSDAVLQTTT